MTIARGIMQIGRLNIYPTVTTLNSITPDGYAFCGDLVSFSVSVANVLGTPIPTGTVQIKDFDTDTIIASDTLDGSGNVTISTLLYNGSIRPYAYYTGVTNSFAVSQSSNPTLYSVNVIGTTATITTIADGYFCYNHPFTISAHVESDTIIPTGNVLFNLYSDSLSFQYIGEATLDGYGDASIDIAENTTIPENSYYIQAIYSGEGCFAPSYTASGTNGVIIHSVSSDTEATEISTAIAISSTFCIHDSTSFIATITPTNLDPPNIGSVTWTATSDTTTITLGTDNSVVAGTASINVPGDTFPFVGSWDVTATYTGDGYCYANSTSPVLVVNPTLYEVIIDYSSGPTSFCYTDPQSFTYDVSSVDTGTISGTFRLINSDVGTVSTVIQSGSSAGFSVVFNVPALTFSSGASTNYVNFTPDSGSCYDSVNSDNLNVTTNDC